MGVKVGCSAIILVYRELRYGVLTERLQRGRQAVQIHLFKWAHREFSSFGFHPMADFAFLGYFSVLTMPLAKFGK
jgi:hypothetical protein